MSSYLLVCIVNRETRWYAISRSICGASRIFFEFDPNARARKHAHLRGFARDFAECPVLGEIECLLRSLRPAWSIHAIIGKRKTREAGEKDSTRSESQVRREKWTNHSRLWGEQFGNRPVDVARLRKCALEILAFRVSRVRVYSSFAMVWYEYVNAITRLSVSVFLRIKYLLMQKYVLRVNCVILMFEWWERVRDKSR